MVARKRLSLFRISTVVVDEPPDSSFAEDDPETESGGIRRDELHLTSATRAITAEHLADSLTKPRPDMCGLPYRLLRGSIQ